MAETGVLIKPGDRDKVCLEVACSGPRAEGEAFPGEDAVPGMGREGTWFVLMDFPPVSMSSCFLLIQGSILF